MISGVTLVMTGASLSFLTITLVSSDLFPATSTALNLYVPLLSGATNWDVLSVLLQVFPLSDDYST